MGELTTANQEAYWVLRAQCHDRDALERLLRSVQPPLTRYVRGLVGPDHCNDIVQEVLITVCRKIPWLQKADLFRPWMFRIASRVAFRHLKKERRWSEQVRDEIVLDQIAAPDPPPTDEVLRELLTVGDVSPASRAVLVLHFQEQMTLIEVAAVLEVPLGTVKSRLAYGLAALRKHMGSQRSGS